MVYQYGPLVKRSKTLASHASNMGSNPVRVTSSWDAAARLRVVPPLSPRDYSTIGYFPFLHLTFGRRRCVLPVLCYAEQARSFALRGEVLTHFLPSR